MDVYMVVLRLVHVASGVFWVGTLFFIVLFLEPSVREAGPDAAKVMQGLQRRRLLTVVPVLALFTIVSGFLLYWRMSGGFRGQWLHSVMAMTLGTGALAAVVGFGIGILVMRPAQVRSMQLAGSLAGVTDPAQRAKLAAEVQVLRDRARTAGRGIAVFLGIAVAAMAVARYL